MEVCTPDLDFNAGVTNGFKMFIYFMHVCVPGVCMGTILMSAVGGQRRVLDPAA